MTMANTAAPAGQLERRPDPLEDEVQGAGVPVVGLAEVAPHGLTEKRPVLVDERSIEAEQDPGVGDLGLAGRGRRHQHGRIAGRPAQDEDQGQDAPDGDHGVADPGGDRQGPLAAVAAGRPRVLVRGRRRVNGGRHGYEPYAVFISV